MNKNCNCECHEELSVIYCSKCVWFHKNLPEPVKIKDYRTKEQREYMREYQKQYYIKHNLLSKTGGKDE